MIFLLRRLSQHPQTVPTVSQNEVSSLLLLHPPDLTDNLAVNISTRPIHSKLNKLICTRLSLALPPYTTNPSTYISGLLHIAPIYITFEALWQSILDAPQLPTTLKPSFEFGVDACDPSLPLIDSRTPLVLPHTSVPFLVHAPKVCSRTYSLLAHLRLPGLLRAGRLRADIRVLTRTPDHKIDEQLEAVSQNGHLAAFIAHTKASVEANPHVLLAYAWVLYMALFSGGRYIHASLQSALGAEIDFWTRDPSPVRPYSITSPSSQGGTRRRNSRSGIPPTHRRSPRSKTRSETEASKQVPGLQFFGFLGDEDGEDIKLEFKKRITEAEILLTPGEKEDIICEAEEIFKFMIDMVAELDSVMGTSEEDVETARLAQNFPSRDSVVVAQERLVMKVRRMSADSGERIEQKGRKRSYLDILFTGPAGKLVRFADDMLPSSIFRKTICGLDHDGKCEKSDLDTKWQLSVAHLRVSMVVPILAVSMVFLVWCCML